MYHFLKIEIRSSNFLGLFKKLLRRRIRIMNIKNQNIVLRIMAYLWESNNVYFYNKCYFCG